MDANTEPCPQCLHPVGLELKVCSHCGAAAVVTIRLRARVTDGRLRLALGRQLAELGVVFAELNRELDTAEPVIARDVSRAEAARFGAVLARAGLPFSVGPAAPPAGAQANGPRPWALIGLILTLIGAGTLWVVQKRSRSHEAPVEVAQKPIDAAPVDAGSDSPPAQVKVRSLESVVKSVVSIRCAQSLGSGFFVTPTEVITNAHVLCPAGEPMTVVTSAATGAPGTVLHRDDKLDLALVHVEGLQGEPLELVDSTSLHVGDAVTTVGSPKGLDFTTIRGTVSFLGRYRLGNAYLQVDMAVNPGNSGGPLLNTQGQVVGVVSMMVTNANSIGFALPINYARASEHPVWPEAPEGLLSEGWRSLQARVKKEDEVTASAARDRLSQPGLVKARWLDDNRVLAVVISPQATADEGRMKFNLRRGDELLCEMFQTKTISWEHVDLASTRVDPQIKEWIQTNKIDEHLNAGLLELGWGSCHQVFESTNLELSLELQNAGAAFKKVPLKAHPATLRRKWPGYDPRYEPD